ncbi:hypothetical protein [Streptomyces sp. NBC_00829]|uniref:hypothetical protein n=1 Tax=Streptomyces sp. NBC_00829 TaxID=2903679 RepID=UPI003864BFD9|nr:hypothetical protein OG293_36310 [Streptomyces sp. NBC_00829]
MKRDGFLTRCIVSVLMLLSSLALGGVAPTGRPLPGTVVLAGNDADLDGDIPLCC